MRNLFVEFDRKVTCTMYPGRSKIVEDLYVQCVRSCACRSNWQTLWFYRCLYARVERIKYVGGLSREEKGIDWQQISLVFSLSISFAFNYHTSVCYDIEHQRLCPPSLCIQVVSKNRVLIKLFTKTCAGKPVFGPIMLQPRPAQNRRIV